MSLIADASADPPRDPSRNRQPAPVSTYRLQFHAGFTFGEAERIVPYLSDLGITHVYASPILKARPGSMHGYDVIDPHMLNPELGSRADFDALTDALASRGMGLIVDIVPNHMGVGTNDNAWWNDCLEHGTTSQYGRYFDIAWRNACRPEMRDKVLLPVLGEPYGSALEEGKLKLSYDAGSFFINYYDRRFPLSHHGYGCILSHRIEQLREALGAGDSVVQEFERLLTETAKQDFKGRLADLTSRRTALHAHVMENVAIFNGTPGDASSFDRLDKLLDQQHFRLAWWRTASDEINYRRFFDINDLAALCMDRSDVFDDSHALIFDLIEEDRICGLRIDHPDGLSHPAEYFQRLQNGCETYVVAEKILAADETLPRDWPIQGTTGYDYINKINGLFVDAGNASSFSEHYGRWIGSSSDFEQIAREKKRLVLQSSFAGELESLAFQLNYIARKDRHWRDFTLIKIRDALRELIVVFPIYRTYISNEPVSDCDAQVIALAVRLAIGRNASIDPAVFRFLADVLLLKYPESFTGEERAAQRAFVGKFQQLTAPVTAKGIEDTAFYIYNRLVSLNEVGGDPAQFGLSSESLHAWLRERQLHWPLSLSPLSTHDTKRSEDVRARLNVLSELPGEWWDRVAEWSVLNEPHRKVVLGKSAPDRNDEYLLYQTLMGAWPVEAAGGELPPDFVSRIQEYMRKALREAKVNSNWTDPNADYETAMNGFIKAIVSDEKSPLFFRDFLAFQRRVSQFGLLNSISQTVLRLTAPGVPDTYQGTELWDFSLVDPDNRRPVDYAMRSEMLATMQTRMKLDGGRLKLAEELIAAKEDGRVKLFVTNLALDLRRKDPQLFAEGEYLPIEVAGPGHEHIFSFIRRRGASVALIIVPRFMSRLVSAGELPLGARAWQETRLIIPDDVRVNVFQDQFTGLKCAVEERASGRRQLAIADVLKKFPVALLIPAGD